MNLIDLHCDTFLFFIQEPEKSMVKNDCCVDLTKLKHAGSLAQFFASFINVKDFKGDNIWGQAYQHVLKMIALGKEKIIDNNDIIRIATNYDEIMKNKKEGKISAVLTIEEGGILDGRLSRLEELYHQGVRLITLTWNWENCLGYPNSREEKVMKKGLKPFGIEVVRKMNEIGMIIDVSHLSEGGFWDVIKHSRKPIVASHSNARSLCNHPRNLTDDMIYALAEKGGVAGINFYPCFVCESHSITAEHLADHVEFMYQKGGEDFVAMGTDFDGFDDGNSTITHIGQMEEVYHIVKKRGFTSAQMDKFWSGNALRVIKENL